MTEPTRARPPRSPQANAGRGVALVLVAVLIGGLLIWKNPGTGQVTTSPDLHSNTSTTEGGDEPDATTTSAAPETSTVPVGELKITVANASGQGGAAGTIRDKLGEAGYTEVAALNGDKGQPTKVFFDGDTGADAKEVAKAIGLPESTVEPRPPEVAIEDAGKNAQVIVILGDGFDPADPGAGAEDAGANTTAAAGATTTAAG